MDGIIIIDKEKGFTSFDVVAKLRGILKTKKIGHTGTLDPDATGVLPVCVGRATKVCDVLTDRDKTYESQVVLGITTDTLDTTGQILSCRSVEVTKDELTAVLSHFRGEITQIPPMYSAVKVNGKRLYEYAREGKEIERKERRVTIHKLELLETDLRAWAPHEGSEPETFDIQGEQLPSFSIRVTCSKGTYIRTLVDDIGRELGFGAAMSELVRTRVGRFRIEDALTLAEVGERMERYEAEEGNPSFLLPVDEVFDDYPKGRIRPEGKKLLTNGNPLSKNTIVFDDPEEEKTFQKTPVRIYDESEFFALYRWNNKKNKFCVEKFFHG